MSEILSQLGVNWRLLLSQGVNFFVLLAVLTFFVYRPLLRVMEERQKKIKLGLKGAEETERRLAAIEGERVIILAAADKNALGVISAAESEAKKRAAEISAEAQKKAETTLKEALAVAERRKHEQMAELTLRAGALVRAAIAKTVELDPKAIDEKLVERAVELIGKEA